MIAGGLALGPDCSTACINEATSVDLEDQTDSESLSRAIYAARSYLAATPPDIDQALSIIAPSLSANEVSPAVRAIKSFADYLAADDKSEKVEELRDLALEFDAEEINEDTREQERIVRVMAGTVFVLEKEVEEAVTTLSEGCGKTDLEWSVLLHSLFQLARQLKACPLQYGPACSTSAQYPPQRCRTNYFPISEELRRRFSFDANDGSLDWYEDGALQVHFAYSAALCSFNSPFNRVDGL